MSILLVRLQTNERNLRQRNVRLLRANYKAKINCLCKQEMQLYFGDVQIQKLPVLASLRYLILHDLEQPSELIYGREIR